jgi:hypothetical protein
MARSIDDDMTAHILRRLAGAGVLAAVTISAVLAALTGTPAVQAQPGNPQITVEAVHQLPDSFHFIVDLVGADGAPLSDKVVTATPTSPSGAAGSAATLESTGDGVYQGPVDLPEDGTWTVHIASTDPAAALDYQYAVGGGPQPTTTAAAPPATTAPAAGAAPTTAPPTTATPLDANEQASAQAATTSDDDSLPMVLLIAGGAFLVALAGVPLALRTIRQARRDKASSDPTG